MPSHVKLIPEGFGTVSVYLVVPNTVEALHFYRKAFGTEAVMRVRGPDGKSTVHAAMRLGEAV